MDNDALYVEKKDDDKGRKRKERNLNGVAVPNKIFHLSIGLTSLPPKINSNLYFHFPTHNLLISFLDVCMNQYHSNSNFLLTC